MTAVVDKKCNGYMTVYLALTLTVIIALCLALIEGCRYRGIQLETECVMDIAMDSILAEYHRELLNQYNLFAIDSSYGTEYASVKTTERHLLEYMNRNFSLEDVFLERILYRDFFAIQAQSAKSTEVAFLTDGDGEVFRRLAVDAIKDDVGIGLLQQIREWMKIIESRGLEERDIAGEKKSIDEQIREYDGMVTSEGKTIHIENPTAALEEKRNRGLLNLVLEDKEIACGVIETENLIAARIERGEVSHGNIDLSGQQDWEEITQKFLFHEYLLQYLGYYGKIKEGSPLGYQVEYAIAGKNTDPENLHEVVNRIFLIRETANTIYLVGSEEKFSIAETLGELLAAAMMVPEIAGLFTTTLILGWAFAESVYDVKMILSGEKIPLMKTDSTWHYGLSAVLSGELSTSSLEGITEDQGMGYEDYLRIFFMLGDETTLTHRAMNVVEQDIRNTPGNSAFRLDACIAELGMNVTVKSKYGYSFEIERKKSYITSMENFDDESGRR